MAEQSEVKRVQSDATPDSQEEKEGVARQLSHGAEVVLDDPTRSTLHTGELRSGDGAISSPEPGVPETLVQGISQEASEELPRPNRETSEGQVGEQSAPAARSEDVKLRPDTTIHDTNSDDRSLRSDAVSDRRPTPGSPEPQLQSENPSPSVAWPDAPVQSDAVEQVGSASTDEVNDAPEAVTLTGGAVAENAEGAAVGTLSITDPDAGDTHQFAVSDDRFEVVDGTLRLKPGIALDHETAAQVSVEVTATDAGGLSVSETFTIDVVQMPTMSVSSGFKASYFDVDHRVKRMDDIDWSAHPTQQEVISDINYKNSHDSFWEGGSRDTFGVQINGNVAVKEGGSFSFHLGGDDGAVLFVNGQPVINNDGVHGFRTRSGEIELEPGTHHIEVRYFENTGRAGLKLEWEGPGFDGRQLVTAPDGAANQTASGVPINVDFKFGKVDMPEGATLTLEDLPEGSVVQAGSETAVVRGSESIDITGWDTALLSIVPPTDFVGEVNAEFCLTVVTEGGQTVDSTQPLVFAVNEAHLPTPSAEMVGGFRASYFDVDHRLSRIDDIDWNSDPTAQEMVQEIDYAKSRGSFWDGGSKDTFGARLEGQVTIEEGGSYTFFAGGDDGVILYINGEPVIDNDGQHGFRTRSGEMELEPGTYEIELRYFENAGHAGLRLEWEGPDTEGRELVRADAISAVEENGVLETGISLDGASDSATVELVGLPIDTIVVSGEDSLVAGVGPVDISGLDISSLQISPPPSFEGMIDGEIVITDVAFNDAVVSSRSEFSITVGDVQDLSQEGETQLIAVPLEVASSNEPYDSGWDSAPPEARDDGGQDGDVMAEATILSSDYDMAEINLETYERTDW